MGTLADEPNSIKRTNPNPNINLFIRSILDINFTIVYKVVNMIITLLMCSEQ